jgi:hypothetical protein
VLLPFLIASRCIFIDVSYASTTPGVDMGDDSFCDPTAAGNGEECDSRVERTQSFWGVEQLLPMQDRYCEL